MSDEFTIEVVRFEPTDSRLGRHVVHDSRSKRYAARASDPRTLRSVRHPINIQVLDQGNLGSCTGHAGTYALAADAFWREGQKVLRNDLLEDEAYAVALYSEATTLDPWPGQYEPDDTGSDGLSVAKAVHKRGLISGYQHALSLDAALTALAERPVMIGSSWHSGMFSPRADGKLTVSGPVEGGHEYLLDQLDVEQERVWIRNSWGGNWGQSGRAWLQWDDLGALLADYGDCTILVPKAEPPPVPEPVPPKPKDAALAAALEKYLDNRSAARYLRDAAGPWLAAFKE